MGYHANVGTSFHIRPPHLWLGVPKIAHPPQAVLWVVWYQLLPFNLHFCSSLTNTTTSSNISSYCCWAYGYSYKTARPTMAPPAFTNLKVIKILLQEIVVVSTQDSNQMGCGSTTCVVYSNADWGTPY
eukprot:scaffold203062_cov70-Attheya_sp.AAC.1